MKVFHKAFFRVAMLAFLTSTGAAHSQVTPGAGAVPDAVQKNTSEPAVAVASAAVPLIPTVNPVKEVFLKNFLLFILVSGFLFH